MYTGMGDSETIISRAYSACERAWLFQYTERLVYARYDVSVQGGPDGTVACSLGRGRISVSVPLLLHSCVFPLIKKLGVLSLSTSLLEGFLRAVGLGEDIDPLFDIMGCAWRQCRCRCWSRLPTKRAPVGQPHLLFKARRLLCEGGRGWCCLSLVSVSLDVWWRAVHPCLGALDVAGFYSKHCARGCFKLNRDCPLVGWESGLGVGVSLT